MKWTDQEIAYLTENYNNQGDPERIAQDLGRSTTAIYAKAKKLNLRLKSRLLSSERYSEELTKLGIVNKPIEPYKGALVPIKHTCKNNHIWKAVPNNILRFSGCPYCARQGMNSGLPGILYYLKIVCPMNGTFYKVGITTTTLEKRFCRDTDKVIQSIILKQYSDMSEARLDEKQILTTYQEYRLIGDYLLSGGNSELFSEDVLQLFGD